MRAKTISRTIQYLTLFAAAVWLLGGIAQATPFFTQDPRTLPEGKWRVESHFLYADIDESLVDGDSVPLVGGEEATSLTINTRVRYGVNDDLTVFVDIPYVRKTLTDNSGDKDTNEGLGDMVFLAKQKVYENPHKKSRAAVALARKFDTGEYRNLPPELATGTGQENWLLIALAERSLGKTTWYTSVGHVWTGRRDDLDVNPGQVFIANLAAEHRLGDSDNPWVAVGEINYFDQDKFRRGDNTVEASGSTTTKLALGLQYRPKPKAGRFYVIETEVQFPLAESGYTRTREDPLIYLGGYMVF